MLILYGLLFTGCEDFVEADDPMGQIPNQMVFEEEGTATAAVTTLYSKLRDEVLLTGQPHGLTALMGLYADEFDAYSTDHSNAIYAFYGHTIIASNEQVRSVWDGAYQLIYMSNSAIEGLDASSALSDEVRSQLKGEALFVRALTHFHLVNLFGDVPYVTTTDYLVNQDVTRMPVQTVYEHIIADLLQAKSLLTDEYVSGERVRANRYVVAALMARVYLYMQRWQEAESESTVLIDNASLFQLESDLNNEFLKESRSAILQLKPKNAGDNTWEAGNLLFITGPPPFVALSSGFMESFEAGDLRKSSWVSEVSDGSQSWYAPYKYKQRENTGTSLEYSIAFRLAEQLLIRAEARAHLGNLNGARQDINTIRNRSGLPDTDAVVQPDILQAILKEKKVELFAEHGHRWFDLKRLGIAAEALASVKPNWKPTDVLLPIPESELLMNPNLAPQNAGY